MSFKKRYKNGPNSKQKVIINRIPQNELEVRNMNCDGNVAIRVTTPNISVIIRLVNIFLAFMVFHSFPHILKELMFQHDTCGGKQRKE